MSRVDYSLDRMESRFRRLPLLVFLALGATCTEAPRNVEQRQVRPSSPPEPENPMLVQRGKVTVRTRAGRELRLDVEIAANDADRTRGLMFRHAMPEASGMIFVFPEEAFHSFWMKNTFIPLDMLFIDADGRVVGVVEQAQPRTLTGRSVEGESKYVLEVNGGWCARNGVAAGDSVQLEGMYQLE